MPAKAGVLALAANVGARPLHLQVVRDHGLLLLLQEVCLLHQAEDPRHDDVVEIDGEEEEEEEDDDQHHECCPRLVNRDAVVIIVGVRSGALWARSWS
eukprot:8997670-Heterocapsa_arctica.AAC.1